MRRSQGCSKIHVVICGGVTFYPWVQSPVNCLCSEKRAQTHPHLHPCTTHTSLVELLLLLPLLTTITELLLLAVWKPSFPVEQRLLQPIDKNFIRRQALLCGVRGGEDVLRCVFCPWCPLAHLLLLSCLNWVQNDNESSEQPAVPQCSGEESKSHSRLLSATNWKSKSLCHLSLTAGFGREGVGIRRRAVISSLGGDEPSEGGLCSAFKTEIVMTTACRGQERSTPCPLSDGSV